MTRIAAALRTAAGVATVAAVLALAEAAMGRTPTYRHGPVRAWTGDTRGDQNSQQLFDPYTFTHLTHGVLLYAATRVALGGVPVGTRAIVAAATEATWELVENTDWVIERYRSETISLDYYGDSIVNSLCDLLASIVGFVVAWRLPSRLVVAAAIALELALAFTIRDNLILNVVMLVHRIPAIAAWQAAR